MRRDITARRERACIRTRSLRLFACVTRRSRVTNFIRAPLQTPLLFPSRQRNLVIVPISSMTAVRVPSGMCGRGAESGGIVSLRLSQEWQSNTHHVHLNFRPPWLRAARSRLLLMQRRISLRTSLPHITQRFFHNCERLGRAFGKRI